MDMETRGSFPNHNYAHKCVYIGKKVYFYGGIVKGNVSDVFECWDLESNVYNKFEIQDIVPLASHAMW